MRCSKNTKTSLVCIKLTVLTLTVSCEPFIHCHAHALNLAVGDCIKSSNICREALETAFEISKLINFSPKRNAAFDKIKAEIAVDDFVGGITKFCLTRWTIRG